MGSFSLAHWAIVGAVILLLFGSGRISNLMGDLALGIKSFRKTMADDCSAEAITQKRPVAPANPRGIIEPHYPEALSRVNLSTRDSEL